MNASEPPIRIYLSPPDVGDREREALLEAFDSGWIAPVGPHLREFEDAVAAKVQRQHAVALSSGTAALHLALQLVGVGAGDRVVCSTLTFAASANAIRYCGAEPVFIDSEASTWNLCPELLARVLQDAQQAGRLPRAVVVVDLYGQCARCEVIEAICRDYGIALIEDAAEALGASRGDRPAGSFGDLSVVSFNGNKIMTTSGGGMLLTDDEAWSRRARYLATQARMPFVHYEHEEVGYNYRMSNLLASLGIAQLARLEAMVEKRRAHCQFYRERLAGLRGIGFMPEAAESYSTRWLSVVTIDPQLAGTDREQLRLALRKRGIEARPVWKPMHQQPVYRGCEQHLSGFSDRVFAQGLCLPSGSTLTPAERDEVCSIVLDVWRT